MTTFDIFEAARDAPDRVALITPEETWTFHELSVRVHVAFEELAEEGISAGDRVVLQAHNSATSVVRLLALRLASDREHAPAPREGRRP